MARRHLDAAPQQHHRRDLRRGDSALDRVTDHQGLDAEVEAFGSQRIPDTVRYLLLDRIHAKVREVPAAGKVFLVAYGIHSDGRPEIPGFVLADSESAPAWRDFLVDLKARGLKGRRRIPRGRRR